jgi:hypothetical protein
MDLGDGRVKPAALLVLNQTSDAALKTLKALLLDGAVATIVAHCQCTGRSLRLTSAGIASFGG